MRLVIQRVKEAQVVADGELTGKIGKGALVLLGVHKEDRPEHVEWLANKLLQLRFFEDKEGKMNLNLKEAKGELLVVSQFTLYANCKRGRRPDFLEAAAPAIAIPLYEKFIAEIKNELGAVQTGKFGAYMDVSLVNDGPVTLIIDSQV